MIFFLPCAKKNSRFEREQKRLYKEEIFFMALFIHEKKTRFTRLHALVDETREIQAFL